MPFPVRSASLGVAALVHELAVEPGVDGIDELWGIGGVGELAAHSRGREDERGGERASAGLA